MTQTIVVGDIHGCFDELTALLNKIPLKADDRVVSVGDLTVKGPKSTDVLDLFIRDERFSSVIGNHDLALIKHWRGENDSLKSNQELTRRQLEQGGEHYFRYLSSLSFTADLGSHIVVHAGLRPGIPLNQQSEEDLTQLRTLGADRSARQGVPWYEVYAGSKIALFGHWPALEPRRGKCAIGLDTGCVYGNRLTAHILETGEFVSVPAARVYEPQASHNISGASLSG